MLAKFAFRRANAGMCVVPCGCDYYLSKALIDHNICLAHCFWGSKSLGFWEKKRGPALCARGSVMGSSPYSCCTAWRSGFVTWTLSTIWDISDWFFAIYILCSLCCLRFVLLCVYYLQFYAETVKQMALRQLVAGSPLRTLCLLIAGQPAAVFSTDDSAYSSMPGAVNIAQQPAQVSDLWMWSFDFSFGTKSSFCFCN